MANLDKLRPLGWSYWAGYSHDFRSYVARAWKPLEKPTRVRAPGGADVILLTYCTSAMGDTLEGAALACADKVHRGEGDGYWWQGLPVTKVQG